MPGGMVPPQGTRHVRERVRGRAEGEPDYQGRDRDVQDEAPSRGVHSL